MLLDINSPSNRDSFQFNKKVYEKSFNAPIRLLLIHRLDHKFAECASRDEQDSGWLFSFLQQARRDKLACTKKRAAAHEKYRFASGEFNFCTSNASRTVS